VVSFVPLLCTTSAGEWCALFRVCVCVCVRLVCTTTGGRVGGWVGSKCFSFEQIS